MCRPATDQVIQTVRKHLNCAMRWVKERTHGQQGQDACDGCWTRAMKIALFNACEEVWGGCEHLLMYANNAALAPNPGQGTVCAVNAHICSNCCLPPRAGGERGHTVTCVEQGGQALLAAEVTWSHVRADVVQRLSRLMNDGFLGRASVRVFVYTQHAPSFTPELFQEYLRLSNITKPHGTYLLAGFGHQPAGNPRIVYHRIDAGHREAEDQCELVPITGDWYWGYGPPQPAYRRG